MDEKKKLTPLRAIRGKCLDCCTGQFKEVRFCVAEDCPLYTYRLGKNPRRAGIGNQKGVFCEKIPS